MTSESTTPVDLVLIGLVVLDQDLVLDMAAPTNASTPQAGHLSQGPSRGRHQPLDDRSGSRPSVPAHGPWLAWSGQEVVMSDFASLDDALADLDQRVRSGAFVFVTLPSRAGVAAEATIVEDEGITHVVAREVADAEGWDYDFVAGWITLTTSTAVGLIGLTAIIATALAEHDIACNVLAARHHDHLLVPLDRLDDALLVLDGLRRT